jgi:hypothetical protein
MTKAYNEPEFKVVTMANEDVLTASVLDDATSGWETGSSQTGGGTVPVITL